MPSLDLSIVIASFNTKDILKTCLDSIIKNTKGVSYEIIVVENGSKDGSLEMLQSFQKKYKVLKLIDGKENLGFGKANNLGVRSATGEYILFLNTDTILNTNVLKESIDRIKGINNCGVYSCKLVNSDGSNQPSGGYFPNLGNLIAWQFFLDDLPVIANYIHSIHPHEPGFVFWGELTSRKKNKTKSDEDINFKPDWVTGAFMIIPKKIFLKVGGFDENIFMYTEEMELAYRIAKLGYKTYFEPFSEVVHLGGASGGSYLALTSEIKYMIYFWKKHYSPWQLPLVKAIFFVGSLLRLIIFGIIKQDEKRRQAYYHALKLSL